MIAAYKHADTAVFHAGALGDSVMIWPLLRALVAAGRAVAFAGASSKAQLAAEVLGVASVDGESAFCSALWRKETQHVCRERGSRRHRRRRGRQASPDGLPERCHGRRSEGRIGR